MINFTYNVENIGNTAAADSASGLYLSTNTIISTADTLLLEDLNTGTMSVGEINPEGEPNNFTLDIAALGLAPGTYYLGAIADHGFAIAEGNESNNATSAANVIEILVPLQGGSGNDTLNGGPGHEPIFGRGGNDLISGFGGNDTLYGGSENDTLIGGDGADEMHGEASIDTVSYDGSATGVGARLDGIVGWGGAAGDTIFTVENLIGSAYFDTLVGNSAANRIEAGGGGGTIYGADGNDTIIGGDGDDTMHGQAGNNTFVFANGFGTDVIYGFASTNDLEKIDLSAVSAITDFTDLSDNHMAQDGADVVIDDGAGNTIRLVGVNLVDLSDGNDFIF